MKHHQQPPPALIGPNRNARRHALDLAGTPASPADPFNRNTVPKGEQK